MIKREEIGIIGSYSSFFGLLLIATMLSYKSIFYFIIENLMKGFPAEYYYPVIIFAFVLFAVVFIVIPAVPISIDIWENAKKRNYQLLFMLSFIVIIYCIALFFQMGQVYYEL